MIEESYFVDTANDHDHVLDWTDDGDGIWETSDGGDDRPISIFKYQNNVFAERVNADEKLFSGVGNSITPSRENFQWEYDSVGRLSKESYQNSSSPSLNYATLYEYDLAGNRTQTLTDKNLNGQFDDGGDTITTYTYDHNDRLLTETKDVLGGSGDDLYTEYFYTSTKLNKKEEFIGLQRNDTPTFNNFFSSRTSYIYDVDGRLINVNFDSYPNRGDTALDRSDSYFYSISGDRVRVRESGAATFDRRFVVDTNNPTGYSQVLEQVEDYNDAYVNGSGASNLEYRTYTLGLDVISQATLPRYGGTRYTEHFVYDGHGSVRALIFQQGSSVPQINGSTATYSAFGTLITGGVSSSLGYSGEWTDRTGQQYLRNRYYDTRIGRFTILDTYVGNNQDPRSLHKYLYVHGDPVDGVDPSGLFTQRQGYAAEGLVRDVYKLDHPGDNVTYGKWTRLPNLGVQSFRLKPDILNHGPKNPIPNQPISKLWAEVKPLTVSGIADAGRAFAKYTVALSQHKYYPDVSWKPSIRYGVISGLPIAFFNAGGIVFYTDAIDALEDVVALTSIQIVSQLYNSGAFASMSQAIVNGATVQIRSILATGGAFDSARLDGEIGTASLFASLGVV